MCFRLSFCKNKSAVITLQGKEIISLCFGYIMLPHDFLMHGCLVSLLYFVQCDIEDNRVIQGFTKIILGLHMHKKISQFSVIREGNTNFISHISTND